jgi:hypothetical protein
MYDSKLHGKSGTVFRNRLAGSDPLSRNYKDMFSLHMLKYSAILFRQQIMSVSLKWFFNLVFFVFTKARIIIHYCYPTED